MKLKEKTHGKTIHTAGHQIPDHQYRILIVGRSGSEKLMLLNLTNHQRKMLKSLCTLKIYTNQGIGIS